MSTANRTVQNRSRKAQPRVRREALRSLAAQGDETTRVTAIGLLGRWKDAESKPLLEAAAKSDNQRIRRAGAAALKSLEKP